MSSFTKLYSLSLRLGTGTFAEVKKAIEVETGVVRAIKAS